MFRNFPLYNCMILLLIQNLMILFFIIGAECVPCDNLVFDENEDYLGCDVINSPGSNETELGIRDLIGK